jgi:methylated-DNA-[protein]-cysteine S-methyltransferase
MKPINTFSDRVREVVRSIPRGQTRTYGEVAKAAGSPGAARAVGMIMKRNFDKTVPCHRVLGANGELVGYNRGGIEKKRELLRREGVRI